MTGDRSDHGPKRVKRPAQVLQQSVFNLRCGQPGFGHLPMLSRLWASSRKHGAEEISDLTQIVKSDQQAEQ